MRSIAVMVLFVGLCSSASSSDDNLLGDRWFPTVIEPQANAVYVEPAVIIPRGSVSGSVTNKAKQIVAEAEFWFRPEGGAAVKLDSKAWVAKAGETSGFNFGQSPQLPAGKGWVGVRVVDGEGNAVEYSIHNFTVQKAPVPPFPIPPLPPPAK